MVSKKIWIKGAHPQLPVRVVAGKALKARLRVVRHFLPLAAKNSQKNVEYVHQLRVSTRRAIAATCIFDSLLPKKRAKKLQKTLRRVRRAAGKARDLDVLIQRISGELNSSGAAANAGIMKNMNRERSRAQQPLKSVYKRLKNSRFKRKVKKLLKKIRRRNEGDELTFGAAAPSLLLPFVDNFFSTCADISSAERLHQLRICGKRLRYAMELLSGAFEDSFKSELYPCLTEIQSRLGDVNDHVTAARLFEQWIPRCEEKCCRDRLSKLLEGEKHRIRESCLSFQREWTPARFEDLRRRFQTHLALH